MENNILKFDLLDAFEKKEVTDFIDFLFSKKRKKEKTSAINATYKSKILAVSTWTAEDIKNIEDNNKNFNQWQPLTW